MSLKICISAGALILAAGAANAAVVVGTVTADNHYALYSQNGGNVNFVGRNEVGIEGDPGTYNWSLPETWTFETDGPIYLAAWSDDFFAQGLLGQFAVAGGPTILSGDAGWQVYRTGLDRDTGDPAPAGAEMQSLINFATSNNLWNAPTVGDPNVAATLPWHQIPGITPNARWMWADTPQGQDPFEPGNDWQEYLIFCYNIPSPGAIALAGMGGLMMARRRRA